MRKLKFILVAACFVTVSAAVFITLPQTAHSYHKNGVNAHLSSMHSSDNETFCGRDYVWFAYDQWVYARVYDAIFKPFPTWHNSHFGAIYFEGRGSCGSQLVKIYFTMDSYSEQVNWTELIWFNGSDYNGANVHVRYTPSMEQNYPSSPTCNAPCHMVQHELGHVLGLADGSCPWGTEQDNSIMHTKYYGASCTDEEGPTMADLDSLAPIVWRQGFP